MEFYFVFEGLDFSTHYSELKEAINYEVLGKIRLRLNFGIKPGLSRIKKILNLLGNPQDKLKFIHVCGTNGKGSVCKMLSTILTNSFYKTGLFILFSDFSNRRN